MPVPKLQQERGIVDYDLALKLDARDADAKKYRLEAIDSRSDKLLEPLWNEVEAPVVS